MIWVFELFVKNGRLHSQDELRFWDLRFRVWGFGTCHRSFPKRSTEGSVNYGPEGLEFRVYGWGLSRGSLLGSYNSSESRIPLRSQKGSFSKSHPAAKLTTADLD